MAAAGGHLIGRALRGDTAAAVTPFGAQVDDPVGFGNHVEVVLDHKHAVAAIDEAVQHANELFDVAHVQAHGGFVQHVQRVRGFLAAFADIVFHFGEFGHQLDALRLAAAERGGWLAEGQVTESHVLEQLQRMGDGRHAGEEFDRFIHLHLQHIANGLAAPGDGECLRVEAGAVADLARHLDVGQEIHSDGAHALPFACGAAAFASVEAEAPRAEAARLGLECFGKQFTHGVPEADVGGRTAARRFADGGLVHFQHPVDRFIPADAGAAAPRRALASGIGVSPGFGGALQHDGFDIGQ